MMTHGKESVLFSDVGGVHASLSRCAAILDGRESAESLKEMNDCELAT